jgi:hypothetical protein
MQASKKEAGHNLLFLVDDKHAGYNIFFISKWSCLHAWQLIAAVPVVSIDRILFYQL